MLKTWSRSLQVLLSALVALSPLAEGGWSSRNPLQGARGGFLELS